MPHREHDVVVDGTRFTFPPHWKVSTFDTWPQFTRAAGPLGLKGCDVVALDDDALWLIEVKDYTYPGARPPRDLAVTVGQKAAGTMALLLSLHRHEPDSEAKQFATWAHEATTVHLALHVEVRSGRDAKHTAAVLSSLHQKLRQAQKALGIGKAFVTSSRTAAARAPWVARRLPDTRAQHSDR